MSGGKSSSSSSQVTNNYDNRQVLDNGALGLTGSNNNSITYTDFGAIKGAADIVKANNANVATSTDTLFKTAGSIFENTLGLVGKNTDATIKATAAAYDKAQGGGDVKAIALAGLAAIVVGIYVFKGKKL